MRRHIQFDDLFLGRCPRTQPGMPSKAAATTAPCPSYHALPVPCGTSGHHAARVPVPPVSPAEHLGHSGAPTPHTALVRHFHDIPPYGDRSTDAPCLTAYCPVAICSLPSGHAATHRLRCALVDITHHHRRPVPREQPRGRLANALPGTCECEGICIERLHLWRARVD